MSLYHERPAIPFYQKYLDEADIDYVLWTTGRTEEVRIPQELFHELYVGYKNAMLMLGDPYIAKVLQNMELCILDAEGGAALYEWSRDIVTYSYNVSAAMRIDDISQPIASLRDIASSLKLDFDNVSAQHGGHTYHDVMAERNSILKRLRKAHSNAEELLEDHMLSARLCMVRGGDIRQDDSWWYVEPQARGSADFAPFPSFDERVEDVMTPGAFDPPPMFVRATRKKPAKLRTARARRWMLPAVSDWVREKKKQLDRNISHFMGLARGFLRRESAAQIAADDRERARVSLQSGLAHAEAVKKRQERDAARRAARAAADKLKRQKVPKIVREQQIKDQRDKRTPSLQSGEEVRKKKRSGSTPVPLRVAIGVAAGLLLGQASRLINKTTHAANALGDLLDMLKNTAKSIAKHVGPLLSKLPLILLLWWVLHVTDMPSVVMKAAVATAVASFAGPPLWAHISKFFQDGDGSAVRLQAGIDSVYEIMPKLAATCFVFSALKSSKPQAIGEFCKRISFIDRMASGFEGFLDWTLKAMQTMLNAGLSLFSEKRVNFVRKHHQKLYEWTTRVDDECKKDNTGESISQDSLDRMIKLVIEGYAFKEMYKASTMFRVVDTYHSKIITCLMPYQGAISSRNNNRFEPSMLMLYGPPGIGKSVISMALCSAIMIGAGLVKPDPDDIKKNIWQKGSSEFWNGYAGQICLIMDDAFQRRVIAGEEDSEYMQIIRMVSSWAFPLNFADLASKGKIYFGSKFIYGSTNLKSFKSEAAIVIQEPEAVARRINFPYQLHLKPEFAHDGKLNIEKYQEEQRKCAGNKGLSAFPWYIWEVSKHDFLNTSASGPKKPFVELVEEIIADLRAKGSAHVQSEQRLDELVKNFGAPDEPAPSEDVVLQDGLGEMPGLIEEWLLDPEYSDIPPLADEEPDEIHLQGGMGSKIGRALSDSDPPESCSEDTRDPVHRAMHAVAKPAKMVAVKTFGAVVHFPEWWLEALEEFTAEAEQHNNAWKLFMKLIPVGVGALVIATAVRFLIESLFGIVMSFTGAVLRGGRKSKKQRQRERVVHEQQFGPGPKHFAKSVMHPGLQSNRPMTLKVKTGTDPKHVMLQSGDPQVASNVYANGYKVYVTRVDGTKLVLGTLTMIEGELGMQPAHFTESVEQMLELGTATPDSTVTFINLASDRFVYTRTVRSYLSLKRVTLGRNDLEFLHLEDTRAHRNIRGSFMTDKDIRSIPGYRLRLDIGDLDSKKFTVSRRIMITPSARLQDKITTVQKDVERVLAYPSETGNGDCGAPLCIVDNTSFKGHSVCGIHIAGSGSPSIGYAAVVTREIVDKALAALGVIQDCFEEDMVDRKISLESSFVLPHSLPVNSSLPLFTVDRPIYLPRDTKLYKTELYGQWGSYTDEPALLRPVMTDEGLKYPMEKAVANYFSPVLIYEQAWLPQAVHVAMKPFLAMSSYFPRRVLTFEEAVVGIPQEKLRAIPRGTSPGFPYVYTTTNGKKQFFGEDGDYDLTTRLAVELRERDAHIEREAIKGRRLAHVFLDFNKDELRPIEKVRAMETRLISSAPLDYTVTWRRYFSSFSTAVMRLHTRIGMCPGICTYTDWGTAVEMLERHGSKVFDGDFKRFDASEQPTIMRHILDFVNRWYDDGEDNARVRRVLWLDLMHSRHIGGNGVDQRHIYQWNKSLPSGHPFTTIVNSMYSLIMLVGAYISITGDTVNFWEFVSALVYGDDNVVNVADSMCDVYNQKTVSEALWREFGMVYTAGTKNAELRDYTTLDNVTFLKRAFRREGQHWLCPLQLDSFIYIPYWCKNRKLEKKICLDVLEANLEELALHDEQEWKTWSPKIFKVMSAREHVPRCLPDRQAYLDIVLKRSENWY